MGAVTADDSDADAEDRPGHLDDVNVGAGCTEIWEYLSEQRDVTEE